MKKIVAQNVTEYKIGDLVEVCWRTYTLGSSKWAFSGVDRDKTDSISSETWHLSIVTAINTQETYVGVLTLTVKEYATVYNLVLGVRYNFEVNKANIRPVPLVLAEPNVLERESPK